MRRLLRGVLDLLAPPTCAGCGSAVGGHRVLFCAACAPLIDPAPAGEDCAAMFGGPLREALHRLKYGREAELGARLGQMLVVPGRAFAERVDAVAVVPLHSSKLRERGFNQCVLLARPLCRAWRVPLRPGLLTRPRAAMPQTQRTRQERAALTEGAFRAGGGARGKRLLVIDDVRTTGATLAEARRALHAAGATAVHTLALALADERAQSCRFGGSPGDDV